MMKKALFFLILVCPALTVWADITESVTWTLSEFVGTYENDTQITADNGTSQLTIKGGGIFTEKEYTYGSIGDKTIVQSKGYTDNAVIHIPVFSTSDEITITCHYCCYMNVSCHNNDGGLWDYSQSYDDEPFSKKFTPKSDDVTNGYVAVTCQKNSSFFDMGTFFTSIAVTYSNHRTTFIINDGEPFHSDVNFTVENLTFKRTFINDGGLYTLMVPFDIQNPGDYGTFYEYADHSGESVTMNEVNEPKANKPYIFKPTKDFTEIHQTNTTVYATTNLPLPEKPVEVGLYGTYHQITAPIGGYGYSAGDVSGISAGTFVRIGTNVTLPPYRAYLWLGEFVTAQWLRADFSNDLVEPTGIKTIDNLSTIPSTSPEQTNLQSLTYNLNGVRVNSNFKGIVFKKGKKQMFR